MLRNPSRKLRKFNKWQKHVELLFTAINLCFFLVELCLHTFYSFKFLRQIHFDFLSNMVQMPPNINWKVACLLKNSIITKTDIKKIFSHVHLLITMFWTSFYPSLTVFIFLGSAMKCYTSVHSVASGCIYEYEIVIWIHGKYDLRWDLVLIEVVSMDGLMRGGLSDLNNFLKTTRGEANNVNIFD